MFSHPLLFSSNTLLKCPGDKLFENRNMFMGQILSIVLRDKQILKNKKLFLKTINIQAPTIITSLLLSPATTEPFESYASNFCN